MLSTGDVWLVAGAVLALLGAAFFNAAETAYTRMSVPRAQRLVADGRRRAARVVALMQDPVRTLNILALLVLVLQVSCAALLTGLIARFTQSGLAIVGGTLLAAAGLFVFAEVAPRTLALQRTDDVAVFTARPVAAAASLLAPVAAVLVRVGDVIAPGKRLESGPFVTTDELRDMIEAAGSEDAIEESERAMLRRALDFGDTVVREIMVPRPDMVMVSAEQPLTEVVEVMLEAGHSRIPVYRGDRDRIVGIVYAKDVLRRLHLRGVESGSWVSLLRAPHVVPELASVGHLLRDMQVRQVHLAVVVDEYGGVVGLATIEDVIEEIVGEIADEYDSEEPLVAELSETSWRVDARLPVEELNDLLNADLPDDEWDSVGGLCYGLLGQVPEVGESAECHGIRLTAERVTGRRIEKVLVERLPVLVDADAEAGPG